MDIATCGRSDIADYLEKCQKQLSDQLRKCVVDRATRQGPPHPARSPTEESAVKKTPATWMENALARPAVRISGAIGLIVAASLIGGLALASMF